MPSGTGALNTSQIQASGSGLVHVFNVPQDYATITNAIAAIPTDLSGTGVNEVVISAGTYGESININNFTNSSSADYIYIHARSGSEHNGIPGAGVEINGTFWIGSGLNWVRIKDVEIKMTTGFPNNVVILRGRKTRLINAIVEQTGTGLGIEWKDAGGHCYNCSVRGVPSDFSGAMSFYTWLVTQLPSAINCIAIGGQRAIFRHYPRNCIAMDAAEYDFEDRTGSNNASTDATAPGANSLHNITDIQVLFRDKDNGDFHTYANSILQSAGTDRSQNITTDIDGDTYTSGAWPIGYDYDVTGKQSVLTTATQDVNISSPTITGVGRLHPRGSGILNTDQTEISGVGYLQPRGSGSIDTPTVTTSGVGQLGHEGSGALNIPQIETNGSGQLGHYGTGAFNIEEVEVNGIGIYIAPTAEVVVSATLDGEEVTIHNFIGEGG
jgi:hypothetical protein